MASQDTRTYYTLRPYPFGGKILPIGSAVTLHPRAAKYLLGTHLAEAQPKTKAAATKSTKPKGDQ